MFYFYGCICFIVDCTTVHFCSHCLIMTTTTTTTTTTATCCKNSPKTNYSVTLDKTNPAVGPEKDPNKNNMQTLNQIKRATGMLQKSQSKAKNCSCSVNCRPLKIIDQQQLTSLKTNWCEIFLVSSVTDLFTLIKKQTIKHTRLLCMLHFFRHDNKSLTF